MRLHPERTSRGAPVLPGRRRALAWGAGVLGAGVAAVVVHDARRIVSLRAAPSGPVALDHTALVGEGLAEPLDLVVLGDSAAAGYGNADPRDAFPFQVGRAAPQATVALVGCPDLSTAPALPWPLDRLTGWRCRRARAGQAAAATDADVVFAAYPRPPEAGMFGPDGLHPGPAGQRAAAEMVVAALVETVRAASDLPEEHRWTSA